MIKQQPLLELFKKNIIVYKNHFGDFYNSQTKDFQDKIDCVIGLVGALSVVSISAERLKKEYDEERKRK